MKPLTDVELENLLKEHNKGSAFVKQIKQNCWDAGIKIIKTCGHMIIPKYDVIFEVIADEKIKKLQDFYPNLEWLAYLEGEVDHEKHSVVVSDIVIPDSQRTTGVNVFDVEYGWNEGKSIIGVIHSHHGMGAFFSGTDDEYINQNHDVSIVVSTKQNARIKGQVRMKTLCGSYILAEDLSFSVNRENQFDMDAFEEEFTSKINTPSLSQSTFLIDNRIVTNKFGGYSAEDEAKYRSILTKYYEDDEVDDFIEFGDAEDEVAIISDEDWNYDEFSNVNDQNGLGQTSFGVENGVDNVWNLGEDDICEEAIKPTFTGNDNVWESGETETEEEITEVLH